MIKFDEKLLIDRQMYLSKVHKPVPFTFKSVEGVMFWFIYWKVNWKLFWINLASPTFNLLDFLVSYDSFVELENWVGSVCYNEWENR